MHPIRTAAAIACLLAAGPAAATSIDVLTMGGGDHLFSHFGHAAICVTDDASPRGRCYNYGTTDFGSPGPLTWDFVRGRALFWVSVQDLPRTLAAYRGEDRTVWRQRLPLGERQARDIAARLEASTAPAVRSYRYHHFDDNCTTRVRDVIDAALPGVLRDDSRAGASLREHTREGLRSRLPLLAGVDLLLGRRADRVPTAWERMFLPDDLRARLEADLGARPEVLYGRRAPLPGGDVRAGQALLVAVGIALGALALASARAGRARLGGVAAALPGAVALLPWALALASPLPELRWNEVLLVLWPLDLLLPALPASWRRRYLDVRLSALALVLLARAAGLLVQPLAAPVLLVLPALAALRAAERAPAPASRRSPARPAGSDTLPP